MTIDAMQEAIAHYVLTGDIDTAREYATRIAIERDNRPTIAETVARLGADGRDVGMTRDSRTYSV